MRKQYNQESFLAALQAGQRDFVKAEFVGRISVHEVNFQFKPGDSLNLTHSDLGENFYLAGIRGEHSQIRLAGASGGIVGFGRLDAYTLNAASVAIDWFTVQNSCLRSLNLADSIFLRGFSLRGSNAVALILGGVTSKQSLFNEDSFENIVGRPLQLGKRTPTILRETA
jgi:hypothetical protein